MVPRLDKMSDEMICLACLKDVGFVAVAEAAAGVVERCPLQKHHKLIFYLKLNNIL